MVDVTNAQIQHSMADIEGELSQIIQLLRQLATQGYAVEPEGVSYVESMVFATSCKVSALGSAVSARLREYSEVMSSVDTVLTTSSADDRKMLRLLSVISRSITMMQEGLAERVACDPEQSLPSNVVTFPTQTAAGDAPAPGGAA